MELYFLLVSSMEGIPFFGKCLLWALVAVFCWRCFSPFSMISTFVGVLLLWLGFVKKSGFVKKLGFSKEPVKKKMIAQGRHRRARVEQTEKIGLNELKRELAKLAKNSSDCDSGVESSAENGDGVVPEVPEPPKKSTRKQKKRKNPNKSKFKTMMDDSSETSSTSDLSTKGDSPQPEMTVIYTTLPLYHELNLKDSVLYLEFKQYLLTYKQRVMYGFPIPSQDQPNRAVLRTQNLKKGATERLCCRCSSVFHVESDGRYVADSVCRYHPKKQLPYWKGHHTYPCCNGSYLSDGCQTWQYHVTAESALHDVEFVQTRTKKHQGGGETAGSNVFGLDCEMCYTTAGMEVAKVGVVSADGLTVYESFVLPQNSILDYNTAYSGITERDLRDVKVTLSDVQAILLKLLNRDTILVGHGLENDLKALRMIHSNIVDTSVVFPFKNNTLHKKSLRNLAREFLDKDIQQSPGGHNCIEDARACMELMLWRIGQNLKERPPLAQDENRNSVLQNSHQQYYAPPEELSPPPSTQKHAPPTQYKRTPPQIYHQPWPSSYSCNYSYYSDSLRYNSTSYLMPKNYNNCIYG